MMNYNETSETKVQPYRVQMIFVRHKTFTLDLVSKNDMHAIEQSFALANEYIAAKPILIRVKPKDSEFSNVYRITKSGIKKDDSCDSREQSYEMEYDSTKRF